MSPQATLAGYSGATENPRVGSSILPLATARLRHRTPHRITLAYPGNADAICPAAHTRPSQPPPRRAAAPRPQPQLQRRIVVPAHHGARRIVDDDLDGGSQGDVTGRHGPLRGPAELQPGIQRVPRAPDPLDPRRRHMAGRLAGDDMALATDDQIERRRCESLVTVAGSYRSRPAGKGAA